MFGSPQRKGRVDLNAAAPASDSAALPDEVLLAVFALLPLEYRQRALPCVCRRWQRICSAPALLHTVSAQVGSASLPRALFLPRLRAFVRWLRLRAAPHLASARLRLHVPDNVSRSGLRLAFGELKEALAHGCPVLSSLQLELNQEARASSWVAQLGSLRSMQLSSHEVLCLSAQLHELAALRELELCGGRGLRLAPEARLPVGLTRLAMAGDRCEALPPQVVELSGLVCLCISRARYTCAGLMPISQLNRLESLSLAGCSALPPAAALTKLSALRELQLQCCGSAGQPTPAGSCSSGGCSDGGVGCKGRQCSSGNSKSGNSRSSNDADTASSVSASSGSGGGQSSRRSGTETGDSAEQEAAVLQTALQGLTQLTLLHFSSSRRHAAFPPALASLHRLQHFEWGGPPPALSQLPPGPWLARLKTALLPAGAAASSLAVLSAAWQLNELTAAGVAPGASPPHPEIVRWAARHPPLQRLSLLLSAGCSRSSDGGSGPSSASSPRGIDDDDSKGLPGDLSLQTALKEARKLRPALSLSCQ